MIALREQMNNVERWNEKAKEYSALPIIYGAYKLCYKKYVERKDLNENFIKWHHEHNSYDYLIYKEFCT